MWPAIHRIYGLSFDDVWEMPHIDRTLLLEDLALTINADTKGVADGAKV